MAGAQSDQLQQIINILIEQSNVQFLVSKEKLSHLRSLSQQLESHTNTIKQQTVQLTMQPPSSQAQVLSQLTTSSLAQVQEAVTNLRMNADVSGAKPVTAAKIIFQTLVKNEFSLFLKQLIKDQQLKQNDLEQQI